MSTNYDFATTLATIAAQAASRYNLTADEAVEFAWFSVNSVGDASIDKADLRRHFLVWRAEAANA